ncbi:type I secretion C-terminal target domain-containing protein [Desulfobacterales bacterium HSG2]|nr:type I secretion C-terminal target domain-containing protein [Desulfobacterales bacterium HSG2]
MKMMNKFGIIIRSVLFLTVMFLGVSHAGIPEPETLIYGEVFNTTQGNRVTVTDGTVEWTLKKKGDDSRTYIFDTEVECLVCPEYENGECVTCEKYSYRLRVPQEAAVAIEGMEVPDDTITLTNEDCQYDYIEARVDGITARIIPKGQYGKTDMDEPEGKFIVASQPRRSQYYEADLEIVIELGDTDGDGMPDWWETDHGLNKNLADDAETDRDSDGWSNLDEFGRGTDPDQSNRTPGLLEETLTVYEGGVTQFRPVIADSDTPPENVRVKLIGVPAGVRLSFHGDSSSHSHGAALRSGDTVTLAEMEMGKVLLEQIRPGSDDVTLTLELSDGKNAAVTAAVRAEIFRPSSTDGTDALFWGDAYALSENMKAGKLDGSFLPDRSGNENSGSYYEKDGEDVSGAVLDIPEGASPSGRPAVSLKGNGWLELPYSKAIFLDDSTVFSVSRATGAGDQFLAGGPFFEIGVTGEDHPSHPGEIRVATSEHAVYGNRKVTERWVLAAVRREQGKTRIDLDGLPTGGPSSLDEITELGTDPVVGARNEWKYNFSKEEWEFSAEKIFEGDLAELLVFDKKLAEMRKWRIQAYLLGKWFGYVVSDFSDSSRPLTVVGTSGYEKYERYEKSSVVSPYAYDKDFVARFGTDYSYILLGGHGGDLIVGGFEDDILIGGPGADELWGYGGRDIFVPDDGDAVWDFDTDGGDMLCLSHLLEYTGRSLGAYLHLEISPQSEEEDTHTILKIDSDGDGSGYDDAAITLKSLVLRDNIDLHRLWAGGHLHTGGPRPALEVSLEAETGETGSLKITFSERDIPENLTLPLSLGEDAGCRLETRIWNSRAGAYESVVVEDGLIPVALRPGDTTLPVRVVAGDNAVGTVEATLVPKAEYYDLAETRSATVTPGEGDGDLPPSTVFHHSMDYNPADYEIDLRELLRGIQLYNIVSYHCDSGGEDGYGLGDLVDKRNCAPHALDYNPQDWRISLNELLRLIQFYNSDGYHRDTYGEDGFSPGK